MWPEDKGNPGESAGKNFPAETGLDIDKNAVQRIESGKRFVTDIELKVIAEVLGISYDKLLN